SWPRDWSSDVCSSDLIPTSPGITVDPFKSIARAPAGTCTDAAGPTSAIRPSRITMVWSGLGAAPVPSTSSTWVSATTAVSTATYWRTSAASESGRCAESATGAIATRASGTKAGGGRMRDSSLFHREGHHHPGTGGDARPSLLYRRGRPCRADVIHWAEAVPGLGGDDHPHHRESGAVRRDQPQGPDRPRTHPRAAHSSHRALHHRAAGRRQHGRAELTGGRPAVCRVLGLGGGNVDKGVH